MSIHSAIIKMKSDLTEEEFLAWLIQALKRISTEPNETSVYKFGGIN